MSCAWYTDGTYDGTGDKCKFIFTDPNGSTHHGPNHRAEHDCKASGGKDGITAICVKTGTAITFQMVSNTDATMSNPCATGAVQEVT